MPRQLSDARLQTLADLLCRYSLDVQPQELVMVYTPAIAQPLVVEVVKSVTRLGGHVILRASLESVEAARLERASEAQLTALTPLDHLDVELPDKILSIWANVNLAYKAQVPSRNLAQRAAATEPLDRRLRPSARPTARAAGAARSTHRTPPPRRPACRSPSGRSSCSRRAT